MTDTDPQSLLYCRGITVPTAEIRAAEEEEGGL